jgi:tRNA1(Val) A37 N6-methylase TrmN6
MAEITEDTILDGKLRLRQPARGYRVNLDTVLLAAACELSDGARVAEPGCGVGGALLGAARRNAHATGARFTGIERDPLYAALARDNVALNGLSDCAEIVEADALDAGTGVFDCVLVNPPYDYESEGQIPAEAKRAAYIAEHPIDVWIKVWSNRLAAQGRFILIHRAQRLPEILVALAGRLGGAEVFPVRPHAGAAASRVIVCAHKGSRAPFRLLPGLDLHPAPGASAKYTPETEAILRGEAGISFG